MDTLPFTKNLNVAGFLRSMTLQDMDVVQTKQSYSRIHSYRNTMAIHCNIMVNAMARKVSLVFRCSFKRATAFKTFTEKLIAEGRLKDQKYGHLDVLCRTRWIEQQNAILTFFNLYWPLVESLQHMIAWKDRSADFKAEQLRVSV
ncbi:hypothetical protein T07_3709 [Trichinella nelsoni]|uniref:Uncharacterized protein n=1 Tax=Trichinella nelsoni TaxID=6336 RepID=A0A0V0RD99_9BILA|nr:hypothetical protein T07_3709 [Trichinella nelsoni]